MINRRQLSTALVASMAVLPGNAALLAAPALAASTTYAGSAVGTRYGTVQVWISVSGRRITNVTYSLPTERPRSARINGSAGPKLKSEALSAQSAAINTVSGATVTSGGFKRSLQAALTTAHI